MKKFIKCFLIIFLLFPFISCNKPDNEKILLSGKMDNETLYELDNYQLKGMIENEESFILISLLETCSTCNNFITNVINPFIKETHSTIYSIDLMALNSFEKYANKPYIKNAPAISIYNKGKNIDSLIYKNNEKEFSDMSVFKKYLDEYVVLPKMIEVNEEFLDNALINKESFMLYIGWDVCGDCHSLDEDVLYSYLLNNDLNTKFYYLESSEYRLNKPRKKPEVKDYEDMAKYEEDLANWNKWISFASKYNFVSYRDGKIPALQYYENGIFKDQIIYRNDEVIDNMIVNSYFKELINTPYEKETNDKFHQDKAKEFLNKYNK